MVTNVKRSIATMGVLIALSFSFTNCKLPQTWHQVEIINPVLPGFYPDPSVCRGADGYYMVNSTFGYFPGIPIFYSPDLVQWQQIGHVMDRPGQLELEGLGVATAGIFAPTIEYHNGTYYVTCTVVYGKGNYVVTAKDPAGPWSDPFWLPEVNGIDPSLFFDEDGKTYIIYNSDAPDNNPLYSGHRTIRMFELDMNDMKVVGENLILVNGGVDISQKPVWIEGPHIYKVNDYYYLCAAEGGTSVDHSQVIFRSKNVKGPFVAWDKNPILTQRHLDPKRENPVTSTGHADLIQDLQGNWWAVFLACRPYEDNYYNTGRETFMAPVKWVDGWPVINPGKDEVQYKYLFSSALSKVTKTERLSGNITLRDKFQTPDLDMRWTFLRTPKEKWFRINPEEGHISMLVRPETCMDLSNPSFIGRRQQHLVCSVTTEMDFNATVENEKGGIMAFQSEKHFYFLCKSVEFDKTVIQLYKSPGNNGGNDMILLASEKPEHPDGQVLLKIEANRDSYVFYYSPGNELWKQIGEPMDARFLSTQVAGGFTGVMFTMYANSSGIESNENWARFHWFEYSGNDDIWR